MLCLELGRLATRYNFIRILPQFVDVLRGFHLGLVDFHVLLFAEPGRVSVDTCVEGVEQK